MPPKDKKTAAKVEIKSMVAHKHESPAGGHKKNDGDAGATGVAATPEMRMAAALDAAECTRVLDLCNFGLERIPEAAWSHMIEHDDMQTPLIPTLKEVRLSNNKIVDFEGWDRLSNITDLALDSNHLVDTLPDSVLKLTNLTRLNIQSNQLRHLPHIGDYQKLVELRANDNALQSLPPSIGTLTDLKTLEVSFNQLVMLPDEVGGCRHLVTLRARGNELKTLPVGITKLWTLEELLLDKNPLVRLPFAVSSMPLRQITYDIELLQSPPLAIAAQGPEFTMHYLKMLRAAEIRGKLEIDELKLDLVPIEVCEIHSLTSLSMQRNEIRALPRTITDLPKLESLNVAFNRIEEIPVFLTALERLQSFDISHNMITAVPRGIGKCSMLGSLNLEGNHIFSPPPMILKMGTPAIMFYLKQLCDANKLGEINLHGLDLPILPQEISELSLVKTVDISSNLLTTIRPLQVISHVFWEGGRGLFLHQQVIKFVGGGGWLPFNSWCLARHPKFGIPPMRSINPFFPKNRLINAPLMSRSGLDLKKRGLWGVLAQFRVRLNEMKNKIEMDVKKKMCENLKKKRKTKNVWNSKISYFRIIFEFDHLLLTWHFAAGRGMREKTEERVEAMKSFLILTHTLPPAHPPLPARHPPPFSRSFLSLLQVLTLITNLNVSQNRLCELDDDLKDFVSLKGTYVGGTLHT